MESTPRDDEPPAEAGHLLETTSELNPTDAAFVDEFDEQEGRYRVKYDSDQATPSFAVITVVSIITETDPLELDSLYESIDGDVLDALFTADSSSVSRLTFQYGGCEVTVATDDVVEVVAG